MWLTDLARLADPKYGLTVRFENGWGRRGASGGAQMKAVAGVLWHHTAGSRKGNNPSRNILINGRAGLTGPLCHINMPRDGTIRITGAGKANHAGTGKVTGVVRNGGNTRLIGIEMESAGTRPWDWTDAQLAAMPRLGAALSDIFGLSTSQHWAHYEYSDGGKIDPAGLPGAMPGLRSRIGAVRFGGISGGGATVPRPSIPASTPSPPEFADVDKTQAWLTELGYDPGPIDGKYGTKTEAATRQAQQDLGITPADGKPGPATRIILEAEVSKLDDINKKVDRLIAFGEQIHWRVDAKLPAQINGAQAATIKAVQESGKAQGLTDNQVQAIASAAAEAAGRVSAEDIAGQLAVTVAKGDG